MTSNWWAKRLAGGQQPGAAPPQREDSSGHRGVVPQGSPQPVARPQTKPEDMCPNCGSENYMSATSLTHKRCYSCGYPTIQSGTGVTSGRTDGTVKKATQVKSAGYQPGQIVGRVE